MKRMFDGFRLFWRDTAVFAEVVVEALHVENPLDAGEKPDAVIPKFLLKLDDIVPELPLKHVQPFAMGKFEQEKGHDRSAQRYLLRSF